MMATTSSKHFSKRSKLDTFELSFEYNRTVSDERKFTKQRTDK